MMKRFFVILIGCLWLAVPLFAQSNKLIRELESKRGALQKQIAESETILKNTKKDVGSQLNSLAALTGQIEKRKRYIMAINNDVEAIERELASLQRQLRSLEKDLKDKKKKYEASVQYLYKNKSIEEKLMFIFSAKNLGQTYRRMRYVREYATYQRLQGEEILKKQELKDFYEMMPEKFNNKTNGITQRRFLLHGNPLLADWVTDHIGDGWITDLSQMSKLKPLADDPKARAEFMDIKYKNKERLAKYILEHNGVEIDPRSIYDVQVKRLHEYKRQLLNILHVMYLYNQIKEHPEMSFYPRTFIFGAKASAGYVRAKEIIKLINSVADVVNNDLSINGKLKVVFIEDYRVSNAEWIFAAADVSEQISTASKEASGTGNMKFMLNGAPTLGTMDGANVEIVEEVGIENAFIFGLSSDEVINYENNGGYNPQEIYFNDWDIKRVVDQLMDGTYSHGDHEMFRDLYNSLLNTQGGDRPDRYFILKDFRSYAEAQKKVEEAYKDPDRWAKMALLNTASCGKFTSDRTIQEYVDNIWKLDYVTVKPEA